MNNLMIFQGHEVEVFEWKGKVLFNPYHVAECLDIKNVRDNIAKMNSNQVVKLTNLDVGYSDTRKTGNSKVGNPDFRKSANSNVQDKDIRKLHRKLHNTGENFLTESGVFKLIFKSHKPDAEKFQDWVTDEVLPAIGKTGTYSVKESKPKKQKTLASVNTAAKIILSQLEAAGLDPVQRTYFLKDIYEPVGVSVPMVRVEQEMLYDQTELAKLVGIYSKSDKPHAQAIGAIIGQLDIDKDNIVKTSFSRNGHPGVAEQYKAPVLDQVEEWLAENGYPTIIKGLNKEFTVCYKELVTA